MAQREATPFLLDPGDELPLGLQLTWRLRALIRTGELAAGERLPSFRRLAEWAGVNVGTVRAVYEALEEQDLVVSRHGLGTFVAEGVEAAPELEAFATEALERAREAGFGGRELAIVVAACAGLPPELGDEAAELRDLGTESEAIEVRQELRRQIARLEADRRAADRGLLGRAMSRWRAKR